MNKTISSVLFAMLLSSAVFSQDYDMVVEYIGGATTNIGVNTISKISFVVSSSFACGTSTVNYEGKSYNTVLISSQCWLKENLNVGTRINGSGDQTNNSILEKYCYDDQEGYCTSNGGLYQWAEAVQYQGGATNAADPAVPFTGNVQGICPPGWHIPSSTEFQTLYTAMGGDGNKIKAVGQGSGAGAGTNTSGFSGLLSGQRQTSMGGGIFNILNQYGLYWGSSPGTMGASTSSNMYFYDIYNYLSVADDSKQNGSSIRCLKN